MFDPDDIDAALEELDARYLAGEAAPYRATWSVIAESYAGQPHNLPPAHAGLREHRPPQRDVIRARRFDGIYPAGTREEFQPRIEVVHRLTNRGAVITYAAHGTSSEGFEAEWREISMSMVDGDLINRCEIFDEASIDAALARFDELTRPAQRVENAASQVNERLLAYFTTRDWDAVSEVLADDYYSDDRRQVVNVRVRRGSDVAIANMRATSDLEVTFGTSHVIATRGARLVLSRVRWSGHDQRPEAFHTDVLSVVEIDGDHRVAAHIMFDLHDIDAAFDELDARYLAGEAAPYADTWSVIVRAHAAFNRHELPATTPDWVNIDHHKGRAFAPGDLTANIRASWSITPDISFYIEAVHRLTNLGAVVVSATRGTSHEGFDAEWREISILKVDGDLINRCEIFDEADIDAALARFDELSRPARRLENAASHAYQRMLTYFGARDWPAMAETIAPDVVDDDRRRVVNAGIRHGRDALITNMRAIAEVGVESITSTVVATRGERLALNRVRLSGRRGEFSADVLEIAEIDADNRIDASVLFDADDIDAAFDELDARYLAGEAATHAHTWSLVAGAYAALNRRELPATTPDWVNIDHRRAVGFAPGDLTANIRAAWNQIPNLNFYIEAVHRLSNLGAVITNAARGTSQEGFDADWRSVDLLMFDGDLINYCEQFFDDAELGAALARFDELSRPAPRLENAASQVYEHFWMCFAARDWGAAAALMADDVSSDDRRRVVGAGIRHGRDAAIADARAAADVGLGNEMSTLIAIRGERLALGRVGFEGRRSPRVPHRCATHSRTRRRRAARESHRVRTRRHRCRLRGA